MDFSDIDSFADSHGFGRVGMYLAENGNRLAAQQGMSLSAGMQIGLLRTLIVSRDAQQCEYRLHDPFEGVEILIVAKHAKG